MATRSEQQFTVTRITRQIRKPFDEVMKRLESSIVQPSAPSSVLTPNSLASRENFEATTLSAVGPHQFMRFYEIRHGAWMGLYGVHVGKKASRVVFGNPMIAITMLRHDVRAGLYVPVEALVVEREEGLTEVVQDLPSSLIGGGEDNVPLREAAEELDRTLEKLWEWVAEEGGRSDSVEV